MPLLLRKMLHDMLLLYRFAATGTTLTTQTRRPLRERGPPREGEKGEGCRPWRHVHASCSLTNSANLAPGKGRHNTTRFLQSLSSRFPPSPSLPFSFLLVFPFFLILFLSWYVSVSEDRIRLLIITIQYKVRLFFLLSFLSSPIS